MTSSGRRLRRQVPVKAITPAATAFAAVSQGKLCHDTTGYAFLLLSHRTVVSRVMEVACSAYDPALAARRVRE